MPIRELHRDYIVLLAKMVKRGGSVDRLQLIRPEWLLMQRLVRWSLVNQNNTIFSITPSGQEWAQQYGPNPDKKEDPPEFIP